MKGRGITMKKILVNEALVERDNVKIDIEDRGYQFGDGVYEVIRVYNGRLFTKDEHLNRLYESAEKISLTIPYPQETLSERIEQLIAVNQLQTGIVYLQITRGTAPRQHAFPSKETAPTFVAYTNEMSRNEAAMAKGAMGLLVEDVRWLRCDIKSLNLLGNILAKQKATEAGCIEAIMHRGETVMEGSSSNMFIVKAGQLLTHPATNLILNGITRQVVLKLCEENNIDYTETPFSVQELLDAEEVFLTSTTSEVIPLIQIDGKQISNGAVGPITKKLQQLFTKRIKVECGLTHV